MFFRTRWTAKIFGVVGISCLLLTKDDRKPKHLLLAASSSDLTDFTSQPTPSSEIPMRNVALVGLTGSGKTSIFNLMTGQNDQLGNKIVSQTNECSIAKMPGHPLVFVDTVGLRDSRDEHHARYKVIDFLLSFKDGVDVIFFVVQQNVLGNDSRDLFDEVYQKLLTTDAYRNSCLVITHYDQFDPADDQRSKDKTKKKQNLINELRQNKHYAYILDKFEDRVLLIDVPAPAPIRDESNMHVEDLKSQKRQASRSQILSLLYQFYPPHFDCENLQQLSRLGKDNDRFQKENHELRRENEELKAQLHHQAETCREAVAALTRIREEVHWATDRSEIYEIFSTIPVVNSASAYYEKYHRDKLRKTILNQK